MLDSAASHILQQLLGRIRADVPHREHFARAVEDAFAIAEKFETERDRILKDGRFTEQGSREMIAGLVRDGFAPQLARGPGKTARHAAAHNESRAVALGRPTFDKDDLASGLERREVRDYLRNQPDGKRFTVALELAKDRKLAEAVLSGPSAILTGLAPEQFAQVHRFYLQTFFADDLAGIEAMRQDVEVVAAAVKIARDKLVAASGMTTMTFDKFWTTLEAEVG